MIDNGLVPIIGTGFVLAMLIGGMIINAHKQPNKNEVQS